MARRGALNLHGSLLPRYRGRAPVNWVLVNGETETGVSLHYMVAKPDAGELVDQEAVPIAFDETPRSLYAKLEQAAVKVLDRSLPLLLAGTAPHRPLDLSQGSYFGGRKPDDGRWIGPGPRARTSSSSAASPTPTPGPSPPGREEALRLVGQPVGMAPRSPHPGTILAVTRRAVLVAAAQGAFLVTRCQLEGEPEHDAYTFCTLHGVLPGSKLGTD